MIYNGDCVEMMKQLEDCSVDAVISDPPLFFLDKCVRFTVARRTKANNVRKIVGSFIIAIKKSIRFYMMDIYKFFFSTFLTSKIISFKCFSFLCLPIRTSFNYAFSYVERVVFSSPILISARTTTPLASVFLFFKLTLQKIKVVATIKAGKCYFFFCKFFSDRNALTDFATIFTSAPFQSAWTDIKFFPAGFANSFHTLIISNSGIICK